jgi:hypothetical protein
LAAICGGLLAAAIGYRAVYVAQSLVAFLAVPAALLLFEAPRENTIKKAGIANLLEICRVSLGGQHGYTGILVLSAITGVTTLCMAWNAQLYFVEKGFTELVITPLWVSLNLVVALFSSFAGNISRRIDRTTLLIGFAFLPASYLYLGWVSVGAGIVSLFLFYALRGVATPLLKTLLSERCDSATRATVLSIRNLIIRFGFALLGPGIGWVATTASLKAGLSYAGILLLILYCVTLVCYLRNNPG